MSEGPDCRFCMERLFQAPEVSPLKSPYLQDLVHDGHMAPGSTAHINPLTVTCLTQGVIWSSTTGLCRKQRAES